MSTLLKEQVINDEGLHTLMCEVETLMNARPITKVSYDPKEFHSLTPNHLLYLHSPTSAFNLKCSVKLIFTRNDDGDK
jgi:hypothetical protein